MPNTEPTPEATPEVDDTNPDSRKVVAELDEAVSILAAEQLGGGDA